jgi:hypothetical protein
MASPEDDSPNTALESSLDELRRSLLLANVSILDYAQGVLQDSNVHMVSPEEAHAVFTLLNRPPDFEHPEDRALRKHLIAEFAKRLLPPGCLPATAAGDPLGLGLADGAPDEEPVVEPEPDETLHGSLLEKCRRRDMLREERDNLKRELAKSEEQLDAATQELYDLRVATGVTSVRDSGLRETVTWSIHTQTYLHRAPDADPQAVVEAVRERAPELITETINLQGMRGKEYLGRWVKRGEALPAGIESYDKPVVSRKVTKHQ